MLIFLLTVKAYMLIFLLTDKLICCREVLQILHGQGSQFYFLIFFLNSFKVGSRLWASIKYSFHTRIYSVLRWKVRETSGDYKCLVLRRKYYSWLAEASHVEICIFQLQEIQASFMNILKIVLR